MDRRENYNRLVNNQKFKTKKKNTKMQKMQSGLYMKRMKRMKPYVRNRRRKESRKPYLTSTVHARDPERLTESAST